MSWAPTYSARFEGQIIENVLTIINRDFKAALDYFHPSGNLPDFAETALGQIKGLEFPSLAIGPLENPVEEADDSSHLIEAARIDIYIGVTDDGPDTVTRKIMKYVRAMDAVLRTAKHDFFTGMSNPFEVVLTVNHTYWPIGRKESVYFRSSIVELTVALRER